MSKFKRTLAMLLAVVMVICALPMAVAAESGDGEGVISSGGIVTSKKYDEDSGKLTLEAYVTGQSQIIEKTEPIDVVLVLDVSGSMEKTINGYKYDPTYDLRTNGRYYYKDDTGYHRTYYCGDCGGWFTEEHYNYGWFGTKHYSGGDQLAPKTSNDSAGTQFYIRSSARQVKLDALKEAANNFIDLVAAKSDEKSVSNIAIVKFAGNNSNEIGDQKYFDEEDYENYNYSQIVKGLTRADTGKAELQEAVNNLTAGGATQADFGMEHAKNILSAVKTEGRKQVVVMFTDGSPTSSNGFQTTTANGAIKAASDMKSSGVVIYTIGCFSEANSDKVDADTWDNDSWSDRYGDTNRYMNLVSSNFNASAKDMSASFSNYTYNGYYKTASNASELESVFTQISSEIGSADVKLEETTVLKDVISDDFKLFKLPDGASNVSAYTVEFDGYVNGEATWKSAKEDISSENITVSDKTIEVTGFDYSENWVGTTTNGQPRGKKLVVEIEITPEYELYGVVPTNTDDSGLYDGDEKVKEFEIPTVTVPYYEIYHVTDGIVPKEPEKIAYENDKREASLTDKVTENYLYGGAFSDSDCETAYLFDGNESGYAFTLNEFDPDNVQTFYVWEVSDQYLRPKTLTLWATNSNGKRDVVGYYFVTVIDRLNYSQVGFDYNGSLRSADFDYSTKEKALGTTDVYSEITLINKRKEESTLNAYSFYNENEINGGYMSCSAVPKADWTDANTEITFSPYWVTVDGVKVSSLKTRTEKYLGEGYDDVQWEKDETTGPNYSNNVQQISTQSLMLSARFIADGSEFETPDVPVEPVTKPDPIVIIPTKKNYTVTVIDGDNEYEIKVAKKNDGITLDPMGSDGELFAGWYVDNEPADLTEITDDIKVYAKYVSDDYLCTKYIEQGLFRIYGMTLISALDSENYKEAGFVINGEVHSCNFSESYGTFTARALFGSGVDRGSKLMTYSLSFRNASNGDKFEVTPYWVTFDGTTVYGKTRIFTYNSRGIVG